MSRSDMLRYYRDNYELEQALQQADPVFRNDPVIAQALVQIELAKAAIEYRIQVIGDDNV